MDSNVNKGFSFEMLKVFETVPSMYLILSDQLTILTASDLYLSATNKNRNTISGQNVFYIFPIDENVSGSYAIKTSLEVVLQTKLPHQLPISRYDVPDPENPDLTLEKYWHSLNTPILDEQGNILYIIHSTRDSTAQVLAEKELLISLERQTAQAMKAAQLGRRLEHLFAELPARIAILSGPDFIYEFINPMYHQHFGDRNLIGKSFNEALPELAGHPIHAMLEQVYRTGISYEGKEVCIPLVNQKGMPPVERYFNIMYQARLDENGIINGILSFSYDITELVRSRQEVETQKQELLEILSELEERVAMRTKQLELAQKETEAQRDRLSRFFMQSPAGICILDGHELVFELINPPYQQLFPGRELIGKPVLEALPELKQQPIANVLRDVYTTGKTFEGIGLHVPLARTKDGPVEDRYFNFIYQARYNVNDEIDGLLVFVFEVTNMVLAERQLDENQ
ncbi:MAG: PAS domain-containing protein [Bacteroidota bacterium]